MTDILVDDPSLGQLGSTDIRVFGKWTGADVQISDMSLEVRSNEEKISQDFFSCFLGLYSRC